LHAFILILKFCLAKLMLLLVFLVGFRLGSLSNLQKFSFWQFVCPSIWGSMLDSPGVTRRPAVKCRPTGIIWITKKREYTDKWKSHVYVRTLRVHWVPLGFLSLDVGLCYHNRLSKLQRVHLNMLASDQALNVIIANSLVFTGLLKLHGGAPLFPSRVCIFDNKTSYKVCQSWTFIDM
jgi:hypothetical protein